MIIHFRRDNFWDQARGTESGLQQNRHPTFLKTTTKEPSASLLRRRRTISTLSSLRLAYDSFVTVFISFDFSGSTLSSLFGLAFAVAFLIGFCFFVAQIF